MTTTTDPRPAAGTLAVSGLNTIHRTVADRDGMLRQGIRLADDEFVVICGRTGVRTIARLNGRTRRMWDMNMLSVDRWDIDTIADDQGVIWGVRGAKIPGTVYIRPDYRPEAE